LRVVAVMATPPSMRAITATTRKHAAEMLGLR